MTVEAQIDAYIASQSEAKRRDMQALHEMILRAGAPGARLWFLDGRNEAGKIVSNPNIGYGTNITTYADGKTREFYRIGLSANTGGISVYILGIADKTYLARTWGATIGKASVTGYCVKFKALKDVDMGVLEAAVRSGLRARVSPFENGR